MQHICYTQLMLLASGQEHSVDERMIDVIADRVIAALRDDLEAIAAELKTSSEPTEPLTVGQVARRLGVARSTVYAHWREWGGYKLGKGDKAPIRFDNAALPIVRSNPTPRPALAVMPPPRRARKKRRRRDLLVDAPRLAQTLDRIT
jgi:hypothetical protein